MSKYYFIQSANGSVIDILHGSSSAGASLDAYPQKSSATDNQLWAFVHDSASGYTYIQSKLSGHVIQVKSGAIAADSPLEVGRLKDPPSLNQLWSFYSDPAGSGDHFIVNALSGNVIDIQHGSNAPGTPLDAYPQKATGTSNQLWHVLDGSFPSTIKEVSPPGSGLGSNSNYLIASQCNPMHDISVTIDVMEDIVCQSSSGSTTGFGFQLNGYSPKTYLCAWQQYVIALWGNDLIYAIDNWPVKGANIVNNGFPTLGPLPTAKLPKGYKLKIALKNLLNPISGNEEYPIASCVYTAWDDKGAKIAEAVQNITDVSGVTSADLAPMVAYELNLVGPVNSESSVLSSGAGVITYSSSDTLYVLNAEPKCTESGYITAETANTFYAGMPNLQATSARQYFSVSGALPMISKRGTPRPSTRVIPGTRTPIKDRELTHT